MSLPACYVAQTAPSMTAAWVARVVSPVVLACRFDKPPPVELRPTGRAGGYCQLRSVAPDGRVAISKQVCFWSDSDFADVYIHEAAHRLLSGREVLGHGPEFFALNLALLTRAQSSFSRDVVELMSLYDCRDCPDELEKEPGWRSIVLDWSLPVAAELAAADSSAELLADAVCKRWQDFLQDRETTRVQAAQKVVAARKYAAAQAKKIESLQSSMFFARTFLVVGWLCFLSVVYFVL